MSRRVQALFLLALLGVLTCAGLILLALAGRVAAALFAVAAVVLLVVGAARARHAQEATRLASGRTCTCCTSSQHDPVRVI